MGGNYKGGGDNWNSGGNDFSGGFKNQGFGNTGWNRGGGWGSQGWGGRGTQQPPAQPAQPIPPTVATPAPQVEAGQPPMPLTVGTSSVMPTREPSPPTIATPAPVQQTNLMPYQPPDYGQFIPLLQRLLGMYNYRDSQLQPMGNNSLYNRFGR